MGKNKGKAIEKIYKINDELEKLLAKESDLYKKALDKKDEKINFQRNGKNTTATVKELLEEVRITGLQGEAAKELKKKFKKLFETAKKREDKNKELHDYIQQEFGFSFQQMTVANYLKITEALIDYKLNK